MSYHGVSVAARAYTPLLTRLTVAALAAFAIVISTGREAPRTEAAFHFANIDEVMFGYGGDSSLQYVEIRMLAAGQNIIRGSRLSAWNADGSFQGILLEVPASPTVGGAANGRWTMGSTTLAAASGVNPDFTFPPASLAATGMICWGAPGVVPEFPPTWDASIPTNYVDCISYGGYTGAPPGTIRFPPATALGLGDGAFQSLQRITATGNTSNDFAYACPTPQGNSGVIGYNHDANFVDLPPSKAFDDLTWPNSDTIGDNCGDADDDNDGLPDATELGLPSGACPPALAPTDPLRSDTDGDLTLDRAECLLGTDPNNPAVFPGTITPDTDNDRLPDALEAGEGSIVGDNDSDDDKLLDGIEFRHYNTNPANVNTDGDACRDNREVMSVNAAQAVDVIDLQQIASAAGSFLSANYIKAFDVNKSRGIDVIDLQQAAASSGACP